RSSAGAVLGDLVRDALVGAVVPRHRDQRGLTEIERAAKGRKELPRVRYGEPGDTKRPRELDEARIAKLGGEGAAEDPPLVHLDDPQAVVDEDHAHDRRADPLRRLELLDIHQESAIPGERDDLALGKDELRRE